jgi:hypothetical protein
VLGGANKASSRKEMVLAFMGWDVLDGPQSVDSNQ